MASTPRQPAFAIVRIDDFFDEPLSVENVESRVTVTRVVRTQPEAEAEVARLTQLTAARGPGVFYFWQHTRLANEVPVGDDADES